MEEYQSLIISAQEAMKTQYESFLVKLAEPAAITRNVNSQQRVLLQLVLCTSLGLVGIFYRFHSRQPLVKFPSL